MREAWLIAKREYLERVRSKAFRVSTVLIPLVFAAIFGLGAISGIKAVGGQRIVVASNDPTLAEGVRVGLQAGRGRQSAQMEVGVVAPASPGDLASLDNQVKDGAIDGYLWLNARSGETQPDATYISRRVSKLDRHRDLRNAIGYALARKALIERGVPSADVEDLTKDIDLKTRQLSGGSDTGKSFWGAYAMALILIFVVLQYGMNVGRSVVAEKTSRVFEVMLATAKPESMMAGKLLGVGGAGLTQLAIWIVAAILLTASAAGAQLGAGGLAAYGITSLQLAFFVIYFLLGFFFYSALAAGFGATVSQESELQQFAMVLMFPLVVGLVLIVYILSNPAAWPVVLLSLFPPCMPVVMCLRMSAMAVPWWQLALSLVLMVGSTIGVLWLVARIYRVGILMYGKRATLPEIVRWLRAS
jgi:ABC-2 type transport system permease protein